MQLIILVFITVVAFISCKNTSNISAPVDTVDSSLLVVAVSDYYTFDFEKAAFKKYNPSFSAIDTCPVDGYYRFPADFGAEIFTTSFIGDTVFHGTIWWMGHGAIVYPDSQQFKVPSELALTPNSISQPLHRKFVSHSLAIDTTIFSICLDTLRVKGLPSVFKNGKYSSCVLLYMPASGPTDFDSAKWITFLFGESNGQVY